MSARLNNYLVENRKEIDLKKGTGSKYANPDKNSPTQKSKKAMGAHQYKNDYQRK